MQLDYYLWKEITKRVKGGKHKEENFNVYIWENFIPEYTTHSSKSAAIRKDNPLQKKKKNKTQMVGISILQKHLCKWPKNIWESTQFH